MIAGDLHEYGWEQMLNPQRLLARVWKRKNQIALAFAIVVIPAAIATYLATPLYRSTALVQMNPDPAQILPYRDVADTALGSQNYDNYMGTQEQLLKGPGLRSRVARRLEAGFAGQPAALEAAKLSTQFAVRKIERSELFELSYVAPSPETAAALVNLFAEEYVKQNFEMRQETRVKAEQDLKKELQGLEKRLQLSEQELAVYAAANDILGREQGQVDPLQGRLSAANQTLAETEAGVAVAMSSLQSLEKASVAAFPQRLVSEQIGQLEGQLLEIEQELTTLRTEFGENWPAVVEKRTEATLVREQLAREKASVLDRHLEQARMDLQTAETRRRLALQTLDEQKGLVNEFHDASIQYNILKREVDTNRNLYDGLLERLRQTGVMAGFQFGNIHVIEPGRPNPVVFSPKIVLNLGLASMLGLALGMCLVIVLESWDTSIASLEDAEQLAPLPSLGSVPVIKALKSSPGLLPAAMPFEVTESLRAICASILLSRSDERPRVIVVTSAAPAEGKTTVVGQLGKAFADAGSRTLLIEADLRKPDLSASFAIGNEDGLSLYLAGHVSPWPKIHETSTANLFLAAAGPVPPNPAALFHSDRMTQFFTAAASEYEIVIVDAPPLSMADARILGTQADGVVLVVRAGRTAKNAVRRAWGLLETSGANVLGMVLNGEEADGSTLAYYRHYELQS